MNKKKNKYDVCIIGGLGHVGLPLGISLADTGIKVALYDINEAAVDVVSRGKMPFLDVGAEDVLKNVLGKNLFISTDKKVISSSYFVIVVIGTPVDEYLNPKFNVFKSFMDEILNYIGDDQHIIFRSTLYPGTTEKVKTRLVSQGRDTKVSFCPERISEGNAMVELRSLPQIVASFDEDSLNEVKELFLKLTKDVVCLTPLEAEFAKLFSNAWRYIKFSIANQFYQITTSSNVDFYKIHNAMTYKYPRAEFLPRAGFTAGPCLFKDTMQLASYSNNTFFLGHAAMLVNEGLPNFIIQKLKEKYILKDKVVGILGMAFKADIDDPRDSLSFKLKKILEIESKEVLCSDPFVSGKAFIAEEEVINRSDIIILGAPHSTYKNIKIDEEETIVVDIWNFLKKGGLF
jgi:UDP-N-acetyl-D-mannosaminuronic acid dehydrogenase